MLLLLPPSESKSAAGDGPALRLDSLAFPELTHVRECVLDALITQSHDVAGAMRMLRVGDSQVDEVVRNQALRSAPTQPAIECYTGVLYDALDVASLTRAARERAVSRIVIASALFGLVRANDAIPAYRLSAASRLAALGSLTPLWKPVLVPLLARIAADGELIVDLRSGAYQALGPAPADSTITVRVLTEHPDGSRSVVSHFNKHTKGLVARLLATTRAHCSTPSHVVQVLRRGGLRVERQRASSQLDVITEV